MPKPRSCLDTLDATSREVADNLLRDYDLTELEVMNIVMAAQMTNTKTLLPTILDTLRMRKRDKLSTGAGKVRQPRGRRIS